MHAGSAAALGRAPCYPGRALLSRPAAAAACMPAAMVKPSPARQVGMQAANPHGIVGGVPLLVVVSHLLGLGQQNHCSLGHASWNAGTAVQRRSLSSAGTH